ncbi:MAG TPA: chemotaxis protein CheX, partial [Polyangia bacterium]
MSNQLTRERLASVVIDLLESAAFMFAVTSDEKPWVAEEILHARLILGHEERFQLSICVPSELGLTLAANLLGLEPDSDDAKAGIGDSVGELANMVAGLVAVDLFGPDVVCKIGVPQVLPEQGLDHDTHFTDAP